MWERSEMQSVFAGIGFQFVPWSSWLEWKSLNVCATTAKKISWPAQPNWRQGNRQQICIKCSNPWERKGFQENTQKHQAMKRDEKQSSQEEIAHLGELGEPFPEIAFPEN